MSLKISVSGIRGIWDDSLTENFCIDMATAFASYLKRGTVVIGRDTRASSPEITDIFMKTLMNFGLNVIDLGISPTPTVGFCTRSMKAAGGIIITASHNPPEWNGIKLLRADGVFLYPEQMEKVIQIYKGQEPRAKSQGGKGKYKKAVKLSYKLHINKILKNVDVKKIKQARFKVALDSCNAAGSIITQELLKKLGCKIIPVFIDLKKPFPRKAEPTPESLKALCAAVKANKADIGFAQDPDADRLAVVSDKGEAISEELTLVLAADFVLGKSKGKQTIVANLSTTQALDDIAKKHGAKVIRSKVGEVHVVQAIKKEKAIIGGEGNGGVIYPKINMNRDSLAGIALILNYLADSKLSISKIIKSYPKYYSLKEKIECKDAKQAASIMEQLKDKFKNKKIDLSEGLKVIDKDWWLHMRPSNTEPIVRVIGEARKRNTLSKILKGFF